MTTQSSPVTSVVATGAVLADVSAEQRAVNVAVVGALAVVIMLGLVGNLLVVAVYRPRRGGVATSPAVLFILVMAALDLASCLLTVRYEMLDLLRPYDNDNVVLCQTFRSVPGVCGEGGCFLDLLRPYDNNNVVLCQTFRSVGGVGGCGDGDFLDLLRPNDNNDNVSCARPSGQSVVWMGVGMGGGVGRGGGFVVILRSYDNDSVVRCQTFRSVCGVGGCGDAVGGWGGALFSSLALFT